MAQTRSSSPPTKRARLDTTQVNVVSSSDSSPSSVDTPGPKQVSLGPRNIEGQIIPVQSEVHTSDSAEDSKGPDPFRDPFQRVVSLEFGEKPDEKYIVPLGILRGLSSAVDDAFSQAEEGRKLWEQATDLRARAKRVLAPCNSGSTIPEEKIRPLIRFFTHCIENYPLLEHQMSVNNSLDKYLRDNNTLTNKDKVKTALSAGGLKKKEIVEQELLVKIQQLNGNGLLDITRHLVFILSEIKRMEKTYARHDSLKAATQSRIILKDTTRWTVYAVVQWLYHNELDVSDADRLYSILELSNELGLQTLADKCMNMLILAYHSAIMKATGEGTSLFDLLNKGEPHRDHASTPDNLSNVVPVIFRRVLKVKTPPLVLKQLVLEALSKNNDIRVFTKFVEPYMTRELSMDLHRARFSQDCTH